MCCALNHQNILEMAQGHISLSEAPAYEGVDVEDPIVISFWMPKLMCMKTL
jgi:hypothetical protein